MKTKGPAKQVDAVIRSLESEKERKQREQSEQKFREIYIGDGQEKGVLDTSITTPEAPHND